MNKKRRAKLAELWTEISSLHTRLEEIKDEEQDAFDALPESLQSGERGEKMESAISQMDDALSYLDDAMASLSEWT